MFAHVLEVGYMSFFECFSVKWIAGSMAKPKSGSHVMPVTNRRICSREQLPFTLLPSTNVDNSWKHHYDKVVLHNATINICSFTLICDTLPFKWMYNFLIWLETLVVNSRCLLQPKQLASPCLTLAHRENGHVESMKLQPQLSTMLMQRSDKVSNPQ